MSTWKPVEKENYCFVVCMQPGDCFGQTFYYDNDDDEHPESIIVYPGAFLRGDYLVLPRAWFRVATEEETLAHESNPDTALWPQSEGEEPLQ
jgi:hypothetical protein